jgi:hypothetical protein
LSEKHHVYLRGLRGAGIFTVTATYFSDESLEAGETGMKLPDPFGNIIQFELEAIYQIHNQRSAGN